MPIYACQVCSEMRDSDYCQTCYALEQSKIDPNDKTHTTAREWVNQSLPEKLEELKSNPNITNCLPSHRKPLSVKLAIPKLQTIINILKEITGNEDNNENEDISEKDISRFSKARRLGDTTIYALAGSQLLRHSSIECLQNLFNALEKELNNFIKEEIVKKRKEALTKGVEIDVLKVEDNLKQALLIIQEAHISLLFQLKEFKDAFIKYIEYFGNPSQFCKRSAYGFKIDLHGLTYYTAAVTVMFLIHNFDFENNDCHFIVGQHGTILKKAVLDVFEQIGIKPQRFVDGTLIFFGSDLIKARKLFNESQTLAVPLNASTSPVNSDLDDIVAITDGEPEDNNATNEVENTGQVTHTVVSPSIFPICTDLPNDPDIFSESAWLRKAKDEILNAQYCTTAQVSGLTKSTKKVSELAKTDENRQPEAGESTEDDNIKRQTEACQSTEDDNKNNTKDEAQKRRDARATARSIRAEARRKALSEREVPPIKLSARPAKSTTLTLGQKFQTCIPALRLAAVFIMLLMLLYLFYKMFRDENTQKNSVASILAFYSNAIQQMIGMDIEKFVEILRREYIAVISQELEVVRETCRTFNDITPCYEVNKVIANIMNTYIIDRLFNYSNLSSSTLQTMCSTPQHFSDHAEFKSMLKEPRRKIIQKYKFTPYSDLAIYFYKVNKKFLYRTQRRQHYLVACAPHKNCDKLDLDCIRAFHLQIFGIFNRAHDAAQIATKDESERIKKESASLDIKPFKKS